MLSRMLYTAIPTPPDSPSSSSVCPVNHKHSSSSSITSTTATKAPVCPVPHSSSSSSSSSVASSHGSASLGRNARNEPRDVDRDRPIHPFMISAMQQQKKQQELKHQLDDGEKIPDSVIPATGRGNSETGQFWENPSPNQLFRALRRKDKPIEQDQAPSVATVHEMVTAQTWDAVMEFEILHHRKCATPKLARFEGKFEQDTWKASIMRYGFGLRPFDRHDWIVDRCGKEVRYIIDYYSVEEKAEGGETEGDISYFIDARPALTPSGIYNRLRLAWTKWKGGYSIW